MAARALELLLGQQEGGADLVDGFGERAQRAADERRTAPSQMAPLLRLHTRILPLQLPPLALCSLQRLQGTQPEIIVIIIISNIVLLVFPAKKEVVYADKLQVKAALILHLLDARSKQDPIDRGHGARYLYRALPARASNEYQLRIHIICEAAFLLYFDARSCIRV